MKKLLSLLAATGLVATTSATVVACGDPTEDNAQTKLLNEITKSISGKTFETKELLEAEIKKSRENVVYTEDITTVKDLKADDLVVMYKINEKANKTGDIKDYTVDLTVYATKEKIAPANFEDNKTVYEIDDSTKAEKKGITVKIGKEEVSTPSPEIKVTGSKELTIDLKQGESQEVSTTVEVKNVVNDGKLNAESKDKNLQVSVIESQTYEDKAFTIKIEVVGEVKPGTTIDITLTYSYGDEQKVENKDIKVKIVDTTEQPE